MDGVGIIIQLNSEREIIGCSYEEDGHTELWSGERLSAEEGKTYTTRHDYCFRVFGSC